MIPIQLTCLAIVLISLSMGLRQAESRTEYLRRYGLLVLAAWVAEDSCIRCYGFYHYAPGWSLFVDQVPLAIVLIWPCVILSARELAGVPLIGAAIVLTDAGLIEPIAVQAGLWHWTEPGLFGVPPIGILGWALFAGFALTLIEREWLMPLLVPPLVHLCLLGAWWGALRWVNRQVPPAGAALLAWIVSFGLAWRLRDVQLPRLALMARVPGALFFFVLLALYGVDSLLLVAYSLAFAAPYLVLSSRSKWEGPALHSGDTDDRPTPPRAQL